MWSMWALGGVAPPTTGVAPPTTLLSFPSTRAERSFRETRGGGFAPAGDPCRHNIIGLSIIYALVIVS